MSRTHQWLASIAGATTALAGLLVISPQAAHANPAGTGLVINEVYGGSNVPPASYGNDFIELYNPTAQPIEVEGWSVQYRSATGTGAPTVTPLTGQVAAGATYLVQEGTFDTGTQLPTPDASGTLALSGTNGVVLLVSNTTPYPTTGNLAGVTANGLVDAVGYGTTPTTFEGENTAVQLSNVTSAARTAGADTDHNAADFSEAAPTPVACGAPCVLPPDEFTGAIAEVQGTGDISPHAGDLVTTTGVVTATYPAGGFNGFYLQTGGTGGASDATPGASDAIFVFTPGYDETALPLGDTVEVTGLVSEFNGLTELTVAAAGDVDSTVADQPAVTAWSAAYPATTAAREAHEGELIAPTGAFTVTNSFTTNQFGEIGLATGTTPLIQPSDVARPGTPAYPDVVDDNAARAVTLDDGASINFLGSADNKAIPLPWLTPPTGTAATPVRVGAAATIKQPLVLDYRNNAWKFQPQTQVTAANDDTSRHLRQHPARPAASGGRRPQAGDVQRPQLLQHDRRGLQRRAPGGLHVVRRPARQPDRGQHLHADRSAGRVERRQPDPPAGQDRPRHQHPGRRHRQPGGDRELGRHRRERPRRRGRTLVAALNAAAGCTRWAFAPSPADACRRWPTRTSSAPRSSSTPTRSAGSGSRRC